MSMTIEQLAARLAAEATCRGISTEALIEELASRLDDPLDAFIGSGASGDATPFDIHDERAAAASARLAEGA